MSIVIGVNGETESLRAGVYDATGRCLATRYRPTNRTDTGGPAMARPSAGVTSRGRAADPQFEDRGQRSPQSGKRTDLSH